MKNRQITLKHLLIDNKKCIGLQFFPNKVIHALVKELPSPKWSEKYMMVYVLNSKFNIDLIFKKFRGVVWINTANFFTNRPIKIGNKTVDVNWYRNRTLEEGFRVCPESFLQKLQLRKYADNTVKT